MNQPRRPMPAHDRADARLVDRRIALCVFLCMACVYMVTNRGAVWGVDGAMRIGLAEYLLDHGQVGYPPDCSRYLEHKSGRVMWGLGHPITLIPAVLAARAAVAVAGPEDPSQAYALTQLAREAGATITSALTAAGACALLFVFGRLIGYGARQSVLAALALGLATVWWPYAQEARYEPLQGLVLLGSFFFLARYLREDSAWLAGLSGVALGWAMLTKVTNVAFLAPLLVYWIAARRRSDPAPAGVPWRAAAAFAVGLGFFVAVQFWADWSWTGQWLPSQVSKDESYEQVMAEGRLWQGMGAVLFSVRHGALWYTPAALIGVIWLAGLGRRDRPLMWATSAALVLAVAMAGKSAIIIGASWGPRFLVPVLPLAAFGFLPWAENLLRAGRWRRGLWWGVLGVCVALQWAATAVHEHRYLDDLGRIAEHERSQWPHNFPLARRFTEIGQVWRAMVSGDAWGMAARSRDARDARHLGDRARPLNVLNYWWVLAYYQRVPPAALAAALVLLLAGATLSLRHAIRAAGEADRRTVTQDPSAETTHES